VAWNLPDSPRAAPSTTRDEGPKVSDEPRDSVDGTAEDG
jgi:hypothetical protein